MGSSGGTVIVKVFLIATAAVIMVFGLALIIFGGVLHSFFHKHVEIFIDNQNFDFSTISLITILVGVGILLIGLCGVVGAARENRCLLVSYGILVFLFFILQLTIALMLLLVGVHIDDISTSILEKALMNHNKTDQIVSFDEVQVKLTCCGLKGPTDYKRLGVYTNDKVPNACCETNADLTPQQIVEMSNKTSTCNVAKAHDKGCLNDFLETVSSKVNLIIGVSFTIAAIEFLASIVACCLSCHITRHGGERSIN